MKNTKRKQAISNLAALLILFIGMATPAASQQDTVESGLDKTQVCMVDDEFHGEQQLTTEVDGKVYYGCCDPCIDALNSDASFRFATDPVTGGKVSKVEAFIAIKPGEEKAVLYFESKENYQQYLKDKSEE